MVKDRYTGWFCSLRKIVVLIPSVAPLLLKRAVDLHPLFLSGLRVATHTVK